MSANKTRLHVVTPVVTTNDQGERISTILIDGVEVRELWFYEIEHHAKGVAKVTVEFLAEIG